MKWIDATHLRAWADRRDCQETLPALARKLIRATSNSISNIKFPSGDNIAFGGWDGVLEVNDGTEYIPAGVSVWEFGANKDPKGKADDDYTKRTTNPLGFNPNDTTFIFVTPRLWTNGEKWATERKEEGIWKDVKVLNAEILEEWIEVAPTVGAWLAKHITSYPTGGIQPADDFWEEWSSGIDFNLNPEIVLGGRANEQEKLLTSFKSPGLIAVQGISKEEALAFIVSSFKSSRENEEDFFSRSIIVDSPETFRELAVHDKPLILIPRFEDNGVINRALKKHTVIVPLGNDSGSGFTDKILLPQIDRDDFVNALTKTGMSKTFADRYSKESARNITILRRQLKFIRTIPTWALPEHVMDIIPALIVGRWDEAYEEDRNIIARVSGDTYENYTKKLSRWLHSTDSPIVKIGGVWRLTSPFDSWTNASIHLTRQDFELLHESSVLILSEIDPSFELEPEKRMMSSFFGKKRRYSGWIREGVLHSLILTSIFADKLKFDLPLSGEAWVNRIIGELLGNDNPNLWKSLNGVLPLIAEASPDYFLDLVGKLLSVDKSAINQIFDEDPGILTGNSYHTGMLWALESLAWFPQYLSKAALILAQLSIIDPGGSTSNRPINSLSEIFKAWHPQTFTSLEGRIEVLKLILAKFPDVAWEVLIGMLPDTLGGTAFPTHKTRWRIFDFETEKPITYKEIYDTHSAVVDMLIKGFDFSEPRFAKLINASTKLSPDDRNKVLTFVETVASKIEQKEFKAWHVIRNILSSHNSHPDAGWALPSDELKRYSDLYLALEPKDEIAKYLWMFDEHWPNFPEGYKHGADTHGEQSKVILSKRTEGLSQIYSNFGLEKIIEISELVKEPWFLGETLSYVVDNDDELIRLFEFLKNGESNPRFIQSFIFRKSLLNNVSWVFDWFSKLKEMGFDNSALARLLTPLIQTQEVWDFVDGHDEEVSIEYWKQVRPNFFGSPDEYIYGLKKLIEHKKFISAIHICSLQVENIPSDLIVTILQKFAMEKAEEENVRLSGYEINRLFEQLDERKDIDEQTLGTLEWLYIHHLASYGNTREPKRLHQELSTNPIFFIDVLKWIYKSDIEAKNDEESGDTDDEFRQSRARQAYQLFQSWKKVPGMNETGKIDNDQLQSWSKQVRELAANEGRKEAADIYIGKVLAHYPEEKNKIWPPDEICILIEELKSETINRNFSTETFNKRGSSSRPAFAGGGIERGKAEYFYKLAEAHRNKYPTITRIFEKLAKGYEEDAKRNDESAERDKLEY